jgi:hypothetical protein
MILPHFMQDIPLPVYSGMQPVHATLRVHRTTQHPLPYVAHHSLKVEVNVLAAQKQ